MSDERDRLRAERDHYAAAIERAETAWRHINAIATAAGVETSRGAPTRHKHYTDAATILRYALNGHAAQQERP